MIEGQARKTLCNGIWRRRMFKIQGNLLFHKVGTLQLYKEFSKSSTSTTCQEVVNCIADAKPFYGTKLLSDLQPGCVFLITIFISNKSATQLWKRRRHSSLTILLDIILYIWKSQTLWAVFLKSECILHIYAACWMVVVTVLTNAYWTYLSFEINAISRADSALTQQILASSCKQTLWNSV